MWVRSLRKHFDYQVREEGEEWEHSGPLYEHIVPVDETAEPAQKAESASREQKPARTR